MIDLLLHALHLCASCVSDSNVIPPAAGALAGAAGAAGGLGGLGSLGDGLPGDTESGTAGHPGSGAASGNGSGPGNTADSASGDANSTPPASTTPPDSSPVATPTSSANGPANSTIGPDNTVTTTYADGTKTITTPDGTVTTVNPDGTSNVSSTLPPPGSGLTTGPGATDPNDPQQGQQPIGFTHQDLSPFTSSTPEDPTGYRVNVDPNATIGPTASISDMPNTAHVQGPGSSGSPGHKPTTP